MTCCGLIHQSPRRFPTSLPLRVTSVALSVSPEPKDWIGRWVSAGEGAWKLLAADLAVDRISNKTQTRQRSYSDRLAERARHEGWTGLHHFGVEGDGALVSAVAAAELDLPFLLSFADGEAERAVYGDLARLSAALRAASAVTAPSRQEAERVRRLVNDKPLIVAPTETIEAETIGRASPPAQGTVLGCWGRHGRDSGLPLLLELADKLDAGLVLVGPFERSEMYELSPLLDRHRLSERISRPGDLPTAQALSLLLGCHLAVFPMPGPAQSDYALRALAAGVRVVAPGTGALAEVEGLCALGEDAEASVRSALHEWSPPATGWLENWSSGLVEAGWREAYRAAGLICS